MAKKPETDEQPKDAESMVKLLQRAMLAKGLLLPLSEDDLRRAEIEVESQGKSVPARLYDSGAIINHSRSHPLARKNSIIAVMPFMTISAEEEICHFLDIADGVASVLIENFPYFIVKSVDADDQIYDATPDADFTVHGRMRLVGRRICVEVQLKSVRFDSKVWEKKYDRDRRDIISLEDEIGEDIAHALNPALERKNSARAVKSETSVLQPDQLATWNELIRNYLYERGRDAWDKLTEDGLLKAIRLYLKATSIDPQFAQSDASAADSYIYLGLLGLIPSDRAFAEASKLANNAIAKDNYLACPHTTLAFIKMYYEFKWEEAELGFKDALTLSDEYLLARVGYAQLLGGLGRFDEALTQINEAVRVDATPLSEVVRAMILFEGRRYDIALKHLLEARKSYRNFDQIYYALALVYVETGMLREAKEMARIAVFLSAHNPVKIALQIYVLVKAGELTKAYSLMKDLSESERPNPDGQSAAPFHWAAIYVALAEKDKERSAEHLKQAFFHLRDALNKRDQFLFLLRVDPRFDNIHSDPRFLALLREIRLEPATSTV